MGTHLLPMDHDHWNDRTPATRRATDQARCRVAGERAADRHTLSVLGQIIGEAKRCYQTPASPPSTRYACP
jgi:hypothetical protein